MEAAFFLVRHRNLFSLLMLHGSLEKHAYHVFCSTQGASVIPLQNIAQGNISPAYTLPIGHFPPVHNEVISGFKALRQAGAPMAGLEPGTEGSLQISGRTHKPLCHRRPFIDGADKT
ncbi:hypothetical protein PoB_007329100 [Plakobranchus ocellatus]|uniref:Uncharacterized protein n=1 Tax=Plakobranchus ocellatus TaxID=259542 RepID=A0AAV4DSI4_9GAST|nr:hypothetical protein PoB_007329100 [Plakobranchus ocellatus]